MLKKKQTKKQTKKTAKPKPSAPQAHKVTFYRQIVFTFIGAALVVLVGILYFSLSQALIIVHPALEEVTTDFNVLIKTETDRTSEGIRARLIFTDVEIEKTYPAELLAEGEAQQATGKATLINISDKAQPLVATTRLLSEEGVLFRIKDAATVPANGEIEVAVYADEEGKASEIGPSRFTIPGLNQARQQEVYAESQDSMKGGTASVYRVTQEAVDKAIETVNDSIIKTAKAQMNKNGIKEADLMPDVSFIEVLSQEVTPGVGSDNPDFTVKEVAQVAFVVASRDDLLKLAEAQLYDNTAAGYELTSTDSNSFNYKIASFDPDNKTAQLRINLTGHLRIGSDHPLLDPADFVSKNPDTLKSQLEADSGIESVDIHLRPFWLRKIPRLVDHVYVQFTD